MQRIAIVGSSGSGKSWLARRLSRALGLPHIELDALQHGPAWTATPPAEMRQAVDRLCAPDGAWVVDGNYESRGGSLVRARADTIVWLDLDRPVVIRQLILRTARRLLLREHLWNGNRESLRNALSLDPERSVIRWSWTHHAELRERYARQLDQRWVHLTSRADALRFLAETTRNPGRVDAGETKKASFRWPLK